MEYKYAVNLKIGDRILLLDWLVETDVKDIKKDTEKHEVLIKAADDKWYKHTKFIKIKKKVKKT